MMQYKTQNKYYQASFPKQKYECIILVYYLCGVVLNYW